ncbi:PREDICTED: uncharacterized protein LOC109179580 [Ipomoea nil]|uniref:uncharacterized protein LOC109179580 n=1 Tax=Ipomoea nil TaxID=35883 RepID=UPI000900D836|nr:PREDICTED: uncharacterized protein LOC109179580 [Ipomoea nil]
MSESRVGDNDVMTGTFLVQSIPTLVLFDSGASNSFVSSELVKKLGLTDCVKVKLSVKVASGEVKSCNRLFKNVKIAINGDEFPSNLIQFDLDGVDVILRMDWLVQHKS